MQKFAETGLFCAESACYERCREIHVLMWKRSEGAKNRK